MIVDTLVIVVYNRMANVNLWMKLLASCPPVRVVVIHNNDTPQPIPDCIYINRPNIGFDTGAFQDVCRNRLQGFPDDWQRLLWVTDDTFPMSRDFLTHFEGDEVRCMKISPFVRRHIRTTGFAISRAQAERLVFPADPITTKDQCYAFEHRGNNTFLKQCPNAVQVWPDETSPLWDTGYHRKLDRYTEFKSTWGLDAPTTKELIAVNTVDVICPIYKQFPAIISSMIMQTHRNWRLRLIHDGPDDNGIESYINAVNDDRIKFETRPHTGNWGHKHRADALQESTADYVLITNADNQYSPVFLERMIPKVKTVGAYCTQMVHSYKNWDVINCRMARGYVDCGGVLLRTSLAQQVGWRDVTSHSADWFFFADLISKFGPLSFKPVKGCLFNHN